MTTLAADSTAGDEWGDAGALLDLLDTGRPAWHARAACRTAPPDVSWFTELGGNTRAAKAICAACPVAGDCLAWAVDQGAELVGIWGGATARERAAMRRRAA